MNKIQCKLFSCKRDIYYHNSMYRSKAATLYTPRYISINRLTNKSKKYYRKPGRNIRPLLNRLSALLFILSAGGGAGLSPPGVDEEGASRKRRDDTKSTE
mmetsp:Transcript_379/g.692  ORF Transcript_379/g.692 Transcript_379/m.692 type:complete len:100 (+) Transcript_379:139-438(+)